MRFVPSTEETLLEELKIINSNVYYNRIVKGKPTLTIEDVAEECAEARQFGAERYLIETDDRFIGILELLMHNPKDGCTWLGLLMMKRDHQRQGLGYAALERFYDLLKARQVSNFRLGVVVQNEPAHLYWQRQGCIQVKTTMNNDGQEIVIYEKTL
ncbi:GNAT family N-acetyltransferase [Paenibacillus sp. LHD-117]|uniref:GNAT family N-acetyltransferase n=1 Tax=Paenibacillus sp. LHD-117 TaxID=3071412 RepID=UPI0027DECE03|nr:GNAT family N-acetyltransferase [Paenibacillus sp. LHD-117]MDQ6421748.1 GNAT family N-acetyltransferase [Paenibacillus sp. LHD-117]